MFSRVQKASVAFGKLESRVWSDRGITIRTKTSVYKTCVLTSLLYSSETWTLYRRHIKWLERFHQKCLRRILNISWQSLTPDIFFLQRSQCMSIETMIIHNQMRWAGHIVRMEDNRLPKQLFYGELKTGKRPQHKPRKRFKDNLKDNLKALCINMQDWEKLALNRAQWRNSVREGCSTFEDKRIKYAQMKRGLRKGCHPDLPADKQSWKCGMCDRVLLSKAGYVNHLKVHENNWKTASGDNLPPHLGNTTCVFCNKICKTSAGLKRHMLVHKNAVSILIQLILSSGVHLPPLPKANEVEGWSPQSPERL